MQLELFDKTALVCGSTQGIGWAAAEALAKAGARVILLARDRERLPTRQAELPTPRGQVHGWEQADFHDSAQVDAAARRAVERAGTVHVLVNNTGGPPPGTARDALPSAYLQAFQTHLIASQLLVQTVVPGMRQAQYGRIVNIISTSVKQPIPGLGVSNTIRGAVASWAKTLAHELGPWGITVNNVLPGFTETERLRSLIASKAQTQAKSIDEIAAEMRREIPLQRFAAPSEIAAAVAFLASPLASYISGVNLVVDGGRTQCL